MKIHREEEHLDFVFELHNILYKKEISRLKVNTFAELLERGLHLKSLAQDAGEVPTTSITERKSIKRCCFCGRKISSHRHMPQKQMKPVIFLTDTEHQGYLEVYYCAEL